MLRVVTVLGARPQFVKAAVVSRELRQRDSRPYEDLLIHTGQHYDHGMSQVFFDELDIPEPDVNLAIPGGRHGASTGRMLVELERCLLNYDPGVVVVYGDTNTTLAAALAASKLHIPVAHVEAGLRIYDRQMPEEVNRVLSDHISDLLLCPSQASADNLTREGITEGVEVVGDTMLDAVRHYAPLAVEPEVDGDYLVLTLHRAENTNEPARLRAILDGLAASELPILFPIHPRTRTVLRQARLALPRSVTAVDPVPYLAMMGLVQCSSGVLTDSGGLQKEAFFLGKRCLTLRDATEWTELVEVGANQIVGADPKRIAQGFAWLTEGVAPQGVPYGDGHAAERIIDCIAQFARNSGT